MHEPEYTAGKPHRSLYRAVTALLAAVLLVCLSIPAYAYLFARTGAAANRFSLASSSVPEVQETFDGSVKSNVSVVNTGDCPGYIRAAVSFVLVDDTGAVVASVPEPGRDYTVSYSDLWQQAGDGYFYCPRSINPGEATPVLITGCTSAREDYRLEVTILAQSIQARPRRVVEEAWGVRVADDGTISK